MCGIPGQSTESFERSVSRAIELGVSHVSVYPLTIEPRTLFDRMVLSGELPEPDDDVEAEQMQIAQSLLAAAGFERYEVASYAKPGYECRQQYRLLDGVPYLGIALRRQQ